MKIIYGETEIEIPDEPNQAKSYDDLSIDDYHDLGNFKKHGENAVLSKSQLADILDCPAIFKYHHIDGNPKAEKNHYIFGKAVHVHATENHTFKDNFIVLPENMRRDLRIKAYQDFLKDAGERAILTPNDFEAVLGASKSLTSNRKAMMLLEGTGWVEQSIVWKDSQTGLNLRCRPDLRRSDGIIVDLKTAASAEPHKFMRSAFDCHYDVSVAMTCDGVEALTGQRPLNYVFLVVEKTEPFIVEAYDSFRPFDSNDVSQMTYSDAGKYRYRKALDKFMQCFKSNHWPSYSETIDPMVVPRYELNKLEGK